MWRIGEGDPARGHCEEHGRFCVHWQYILVEAIAKRERSLAQDARADGLRSRKTKARRLATA